MPVLAWPAGLPRPSGLTFSLKPNTQAFQSPLTRATQTLEMPGARWVAVITWSELVAAEIRALRAFLAQLRGRAGRLSLWDMAFETPAGIATGTPVVRNRTNLLTYSEQINLAPWTQNPNAHVDVSPDVILSPTGTLTGDKLIEASTDVTFHQVQRTFTSVDNTVHTFSVYLKSAERSRAVLYIGTKSGTFPSAAFTLSTGTVSVAGGAVGVIETLPDGWFRCSVSVNVGSGGTASTILVRLRNDVPLDTYAGSVGSGIYLWGAQINQGAAPTDYLATTTTALTELQTGASLRSGGWTPDITGILKAGDYLGVNGELKLLTADAASDIFGNALLTFEPPLRASPPDSAALTLSQPAAVFRLLDDDQDTVPIQPPLRGSVTLTFEEVFQ
jgi:hypothetical protein